MRAISDWLKDWRNEVFVFAMAALGVAAFVLVPDTKWDHLGAAIGHLVANPTGAIGAASTLGAIAGAFYLAWKSGRGTPAAALLFALALGSTLTGCTVSALTAQGRAATITGVGLGSVAQEVHDERAAQLDACADEACLDAAESAWAPVVAAIESARTALTTWIDALDVARQAGADDGDVIGALLVAVSHFVHEWNDLAAAIRALGNAELQPPDLPPVLTALLGAAS